MYIHVNIVYIHMYIMHVYIYICIKIGGCMYMYIWVYVYAYMYLVLGSAGALNQRELCGVAPYGLKTLQPFFLENEGRRGWWRML